MRRLIGLILFLAAGFGAFAGIGAVLWQADAIRNFVPVPCTILSSDIQRHSGKHTTYSPSISYRYTFQNKSYDSSTVLPFEESSSYSWARGIVSRYPVAKTGIEAGPPNATAYINPQRPGESILVREYTFTPYVLSMLALAATGVGAGLATKLIGGTRSAMTAVPLDDWFLLLPTQSLRRQFLQGLSWLFWVLLMTVPLFLHWLLIAGKWSSFPAIAIAEALLLAIFGTIAFRRWSISRHISDARLRARPVPLMIGEPFAMQLEADAYTALRVHKAMAHLVCIEHYRERRGNKTTYGTRTKGSHDILLAGAGEVRSGDMVSGQGEALITSGSLPPTSETPRKSYPYYTWELRLKIELDGAVDYNAHFPLQALAAPHSPSPGPDLPD